MLYDPGMTQKSVTVDLGAKRIKRQMQLLFHPDKAPVFAAGLTPDDVPRGDEYNETFMKLGEAMSLLEKFMGGL
jgi:hypothetical protein